MTWPDRSFLARQLRGVLVAMLAVAVAALARKLLLGGLGIRVVWVTYYPAVMFAALFGGWLSGLLAATASFLVALFAWRFFVDVPYIRDQGDWLGVITFLVNCGLIAAVANMALRSRTRVIAATEAQVQAETANRAKSAFLASMSHELRTPLNAILGFSSMMQADVSLPPEHSKTLGVINRSGAHLLSLINSVLDMAKIESGSAALDIETIDLHKLLEDTTQLLRQSADLKGLNLRLDVADGVVRMVQADEARLRLVVTNLIGNAIKFTSTGGVSVVVGMHGGEEEPRLLTIEVVDTGEGIAPDALDRVFEPFVQLTSDSDSKGTGLGLTITRDFVRRMGGTVELKSEVGRGSAFRIEIPVRAVVAQSAESDMQRSLVARLAQDEPAWRTLIIEDEDVNAQLLQQLLERAGFQVQVAENGKKGIEAFQSWRPHFIWMDWRMPVMDGLEATRRIRALEGGQEVKIAVLSASAFEDEKAQMMAAGADDYVAKPLQLDAIYNCMARLLGISFVAGCSEPTTGAHRGAAIDPVALAALPASAILELKGAVVSLNSARIATAIEQVALSNAPLADTLARHAQQLQYTKILLASQATGDSPIA